ARFLLVRETDSGGMEGEFRLPREAAARLRTLLDAYAKPKAKGDDRPLRVRNADAFIALLEQQITAELLVLVNAESLPDDGPVGDPSSTDTAPTDTAPGDAVQRDDAQAGATREGDHMPGEDVMSGGYQPPGSGAAAGEPTNGDFARGTCGSSDSIGDVADPVDGTLADGIATRSGECAAPDDSGSNEVCHAGENEDAAAGGTAGSADIAEAADSTEVADTAQTVSDRQAGIAETADAAEHESSGQGTARPGKVGPGKARPGEADYATNREELRRTGSGPGVDRKEAGGAKPDRRAEQEESGPNETAPGESADDGRVRRIGGPGRPGGRGAPDEVGSRRNGGRGRVRDRDRSGGPDEMGGLADWRWQAVLRTLPGLLLSTGQLLPITDVHRLARTSTLMRLVMNADGQVLDMGRKVRLATAAQRRAVLARYDTCWVEGCPLPASMCQVDHLDNWSEGGLTDLAKLGPACQWHNRDRYLRPDRYRRRQIGPDRWAFTYTGPSYATTRR
ncbi:DUF222 domain-containing protein, partial [Sphaerimonospora cavernae]